MESADHQGFWGPWRGRWGKVGRRWSGLPSKFKQWWRKRKPQGHLVLQPPLQCEGHTIQEQVKSATGQGSEELLSGGKKTFLLPSSSLKILTPLTFRPKDLTVCKSYEYHFTSTLVVQCQDIMMSRIEKTGGESLKYVKSSCKEGWNKLLCLLEQQAMGINCSKGDLQ